MQYKLLIVEDDARQREILVDYFKAKKFNITSVADGKQALEKLMHNSFDLLLLDIMMPNVDGLTVCKNIRRKSNVPIVFITAKSAQRDVLVGYDLGADDYITKPFSLPVLHAKVLSLIRRTKGALGDELIVGTIRINLATRAVIAYDTLIFLSPKEYDLLLYLMENKNIVLSREQILNAVWGYTYDGDIRTVDTHIKKLRASLQQSAKHIQTVIKVGYCFKEVLE